MKFKKLDVWLVLQQTKIKITFINLTPKRKISVKIFSEKVQNIFTTKVTTNKQENTQIYISKILNISKRPTTEIMLNYFSKIYLLLFWEKKKI